MPAVPAPEAPTARQLLSRYHPRHTPHGATFDRTRSDGSQVYRCACSELLVVTAVQLRQYRP